MQLLSSSAKIRNLTIRNRIVMPAFGLKYTGLDRKPNDRLINFYAARAAGGCGLLVVGGVGVDLVGSGLMLPSIESDEFIEPWSRLAAAVHKHSSKVFLQLFHAGRYQHSIMIRGKQAVAPSAVPSRYTKETPQPLDHNGILEIHEKFAAAAVRARKAGMDGVEIIASAGYLICQFLSPITNLRDDEYGGSLANRCRFGEELLQRTRQAVGDDFPITMRISGSEYMPGGNTNQDMVEICKRFEAAGADGFNITGGWHETRVPQLPAVVPHGAFAYLAAEIRKAVDVPVFASNRIVRARQAEQLLRSSVCDFVCIGRAQIADPEWSAKSLSNRIDEIRPCIGCLQGCMDRLFKVRDVQCLCNAQAGFEGERMLTVTKHPRKIMIVGGGPAGLEAALTAAQRGHDIHLFEAGPYIGGQLPLAAAPPGREDFRNLLNFYENELLRRNLKVHLGTRVTVNTVRKIAPDALLLATGSRPLIPNLPGLDLDHVETAWDVLLQRVPIGDKVVVIGGGATGVETAITLAEMGTINGETLKFLFKHEAENPDTLRRLCTRGSKQVTILEMRPKLGEDIGPANKWVFLKELDMLGVMFKTNAKVVRIEPGRIVYETDGMLNTIDADSVVIALGAESDTTLADELSEAGIEFTLIGDARKPNSILEAVHEGFLAARVV